ncbi:MAG TPA: AgmX/PglI C-terminal domain-containing protein [Polyangiaceae bacterium]|jgi:hypothetical protein|nr:AgmX/PglI C-terminal domain-containing protein [Polyangiaceae bacterium]
MRLHAIALSAVLVSAVLGCGGSTQSNPAPATPAPATASDVTPAPGIEEKPADTAPAASAAASDTTDDSAAAGGDPDKRTMEIIAATVKEHRKDARACYEKGAKEVPGLKGDLVVHFVLTPKGKVKTAELNRERSTITEASVVKCVIDVVTAIDFPKSSRGMESTVNYPFNFTP